MSDPKFDELSPEVQSFFRELRGPDIALLRRTMRRQAELEVASKLVKRVFFAIGATIAAVVTFREDIMTLLGWFR